MLRFLLLAVSTLCTLAHPRHPRAVETDKEDKDIAAAETRVDPYMFDGMGVGYGGPLGVVGRGYEPHGMVGGYGGFGGGLIHSGINEGGLALGGKGEHLYRHELDDGYLGNRYHAGGGLNQGGYHGTEGYKDDKHHLADDHDNRQYYSGVKGGSHNAGNGEVFDKNQGFSDHAFNSVGDNEEKGHQKGHHKTGFHKSYHKDESGNDESYYDSDHDQGNHEYGKKYGDNYGSNYNSGLRGDVHSKEYNAGSRGEAGYQGNGKLIAENRGHRDHYGDSGYYDNDSKFGRAGGAHSSQLGKLGSNLGYQSGYNNGRNFEGAHFSDYLGPRGY